MLSNKSNSSLTPKKSFFKQRILGQKLAYFLYLCVAVLVLLEVFGAFLAGSLVDQRLSKSAIRQNLQKAEYSEKFNPQKTNNSLNKPALHPYLGYSLNPTQNSRPVNDFGFWGDAPNFEHMPGQFNIYITGGSVASQTYKGRESLIAALEQAPFFQDKEIRVFNLAMGGYKQPQQLIALNYVLFLGAHIDMVINIDGFNEIALPYTGNRPQAIYPFYPRNWARFALGNTRSQYDLIRLEGQQLLEKRSKIRSAFTDSWISYSYTCLAIGKLKLASINRQILDLQKKMEAEVQQQAGDFQLHGPPYDFGEEKQYFQDFVDKWKQASIQMNQICQANDIAYFHFLQPNQYVPGSKVLTKEENEIANILSTAKPKGATFLYMQAVQKGYHLLQSTGFSLAAKADLHFSDLTMMFKEEKEAVYADFCCHFNPYGIQHLNKEIASHILEKW